MRRVVGPVEEMSNHLARSLAVTLEGLGGNERSRVATLMEV